MTRKNVVAQFLGTLTMLVILSQQGALAQQEHQRMSGSQMDTTRQHGMMMSHEMMQEMQKHRTECQQLNRSSDSALTEIRAVRNSNDPKKLQAALRAAESSLTRVRDHTANCMKMMQNMQGGSQMQRGGRMMEHERMRDSMIMRHPGMRDSMQKMPMDSTMMQKY